MLCDEGGVDPRKVVLGHSGDTTEEKVLPYLREHGVTEEQVHTMLVDVPRRVFEG